MSGTGASASATDTKSWEKVYFAAGSTSLTKAAKTELRQIAREYAGASTIVVTGYVQKGGSAWNNYTLAKKRAKAVTSYLKARGMTAKLTTKSGGVPKTAGTSKKARRATLAITMPAAVSAPVVSYKIGDTGPGGGIVFILPSTAGNETGKYFEAAPANSSVGIVWCNDTTTSLGTTEEPGDIGNGAANTALMLGACTLGAANSAGDYISPNGTADWFLPSIGELNLMYTNLQQAIPSIGDFTPSYYWSSSEEFSPFGAEYAWVQGFHTGSQDRNFKGFHTQLDLSVYARPVRTFS